jgi:2-polyprenyl-3-methyl-5-hydroxy-6-metoxy-1,4-benzoquinol methylase
VGWLTLKRIPEQEIMDTDEEVDAYASAAAATYLESIDRTFVEHLARLIEGTPLASGECRVLDFGCGPGQIPIMLARRWPRMRILGLDAGPNMIEQARSDAATAAVDIDFDVQRLGPQGDARLPYTDGEFDIVLCNSVLHHLDDPLGTLDELARVVNPGGAVLVRDLLRPPAPLYRVHVWVFGRHYSGEMRRLYQTSVHAAYTLGELRAMLAASRLNDGRTRVFQRGLTHLGIERPARR